MGEAIAGGAGFDDLDRKGESVWLCQPPDAGGPRLNRHYKITPGGFAAQWPEEAMRTHLRRLVNLAAPHMAAPRRPDVPGSYTPEPAKDAGKERCVR